jgi:hypothetical protein
VLAPSPEDPERTIKLGVRGETFQQYAGRLITSVIAQYYGIVQGDLVSAQHAFKGLNRKLLDNGDMRAEEKVVIYSWRPLADYVLVGFAVERCADQDCSAWPPGKVFAVLTRLDDSPDVNGILGSIGRWNWVREDPQLPKAPVDWNVRYGKKLWSR